MKTEAKMSSIRTIQINLQTWIGKSIALSRYSILLLAVACSTTAPSTRPETPEPSLYPSETVYPEATPTRIDPTSTPIPTQEPDFGLMKEDSHSVTINWNEDADLPSGQVALVIPRWNLGFDEWSAPPIFEYLTWAGNRGRLFEIEYDGAQDLQDPGILHLPPAADRYFAFGFSDFTDLKEIYWIDFRTRQLFGYETQCESTTTLGDDALAIGPEWFAYECDEDKTTWHLFSLEDPSVTTSLQLPFNNEFSKGFRPSWLDADTLILDHRARPINRCVVDLNDPSEPVVSCQEFNEDITLGPISPDGKRMEVRVSTDTSNSHPQKIGVIKTACFSSSIGCFPPLTIESLGADAGPRGVFLEDSAWLPDSSGILYVQLQSIKSAWADNTFLWTFDLNQQKFTQIAYFDIPITFRHINDHSDGIWSSDDTRVLLQNTLEIYSYDMTDGTLQHLSDERGFAIGTVVLP